MISKRAPYWDRVAACTVVSQDGCHVFTGHKDECGYGRIGVNGSYPRVHREVWKKHHGDIPSMMCVCHKCDNPSCINPDHLFLGTHKDNMRDRANKGRYNHKGERNNSAKLTLEQVKKIRMLIAAGNTMAALGRQFGVTDTTIRAIKFNRAWL